MSETLAPLTQADLARFIGTTRYYRYTMGLILTDGAHYLSTHGAGWLLDLIASARLVPEVRAQPYEFWTLVVNGETRTAEITCTTGEGARTPPLYRQSIPWTDFPLDRISLLVVADSDLGKIVLLPAEY